MVHSTNKASRSLVVSTRAGQTAWSAPITFTVSS